MLPSHLLQPDLANLQQRCRSCSVPRPMTKVTLFDVAENAGVSQATASRVLSGKGGVAHGTRKAVISAAATLGYRRTTRGRVIGVVLPELVNPIFATFAHRFATSLAQSGYTPVLC